jgi:succinate-semialdehyde dehydrogenase/glutarate-semialdehyde dehydrogenase
VARALALAESLDCGVVNINETTNYWELHVPYGGMRSSGIGRIGGRASIEAMTDVQTIILDLRTGA